MNFTFLNTINLDRSPTYIQTHLPVYITMTTIPSRLRNTLKIIKHFLKYVSGFEKIILNVPWKYNRWPDFVVSLTMLEKINDARFVLNRCEDYGPLTKIMGSLHLIPNNSITIIADDMCYKLNAFKDIAEIQDKNLKKSFSFYVYPYHKDNKNNNNSYGNNFSTSVLVPQGADLISTYTQNFSYFPEWFNNFKKRYPKYYESACFFVDDQLLGWYFQSHGIPMEQVERRHRMIYIKNCDISDKSQNLNRLKGNQSRENTMSKCFTELSEYQPL